MVNYVVIKNNAAESGESGDSDTYGICACSYSDGVLEILGCVKGISADLDWLKSLSDKLNNNCVDPIHLNYIIEDELHAFEQ